MGNPSDFPYANPLGWHYIMCTLRGAHMGALMGTHWSR